MTAQEAPKPAISASEATVARINRSYEIYHDCKAVLELWRTNKPSTVKGVPCFYGDIPITNPALIKDIAQTLADAITATKLLEQFKVQYVEFKDAEDKPTGTVQFQLVLLNKANVEANKKLVPHHVSDLLNSIAEALHISDTRSFNRAM